MNIDIREAAMADAAVIADYNNRMAEETESRSLDSALLSTGVAALLGDPAKGRYWVAESDRRIVGQIIAQHTYLQLGMTKPGYEIMETQFNRTTG